MLKFLQQSTVALFELLISLIRQKTILNSNMLSHPLFRKHTYKISVYYRKSRTFHVQVS